MKSSAIRIVACRFVVGWCFFGLSATGAELWVSTTGNDRNPGTEARPFASVSRALQKGSELRKPANASEVQATQIILRGGIYPLKTALSLRSTDSGTSNRP